VSNLKRQIESLQNTTQKKLCKKPKDKNFSLENHISKLKIQIDELN